jgi:predicted nucleic acid-binding protein
MKIIVDANIVFSAILNTNSKIADLLLNSKGIFEFISPEYLLTETKKYHKKISLISKMSLDEVIRIENKITKPISFLSGVLIPESNWIKAEQLVLYVDAKEHHTWLFQCSLNVKFGLGIKCSEMV